MLVNPYSNKSLSFANTTIKQERSELTMSNSKDTSSKKQGKSSVSDDYKYSPRVENPNPKSTTDKRPSSGNIRGV